jgi:hypothetical protein
MNTYYNKRRLLIAVILAMSFLFTSTYSFAMSLQMDECNAQTVCEKCCLISTPELSGLQYEYSFSPCQTDSLAPTLDPIPLPVYHPPQ